MAAVAPSAWTRSATRPALLLGLALLLTWVVLLAPTPPSQVPPAWPAVGLLTGLLLRVPSRRGHVLAGLGAVGLTVVQVLHDLDLPVAAAFSVLTVLESMLVARLIGGREHRVPTLAVDGDVSRMIGSSGLGAALAALGYGLVDRVAGHGDPWLAAAGALGTHLAALIVLLPLFLRPVPFSQLATRRERVVMWALAVGTTVLIFSNATAPPLVFLVMPMFAWLGFRGTLREASGVLVMVGAVGIGASALGLGPVAVLASRYGLPTELVDGYLQVFLLDCALVLLPLSVAVAQQRQAAAQAVRGRDTLARIVDSATGTAIVVVDLEGLVTVFNPGAEAILGRRAHLVVGRPADDLVDAAELERQAVELGVPATFTDVCGALVAADVPPRAWQFVGLAGGLRTLQVTVTALRDDDGELGGYLTTGEDVTERERARRALLEALDDRDAAVQHLRSVDRMRKNLISTVSHELRTPITSILGYTEMLGDGMAGDLAPRQAAMLDRVSRNSHRLLELVENLITLSKAEGEGLVTRPGRCDLAGIARAAYDAGQAAALVSGIELSLHLDAAPEFWGDSEQLERMLGNLVGNAVKFTEAGGRVDVRLHGTDDEVRLSVEDTGIGIPPDERDLVFDQFYRSSLARDREIQGTGLGLSIVKAIVEQHRGTVAVDSTPGVGTRIEVALPLPGLVDEGDEVGLLSSGSV